MCEYCDRAKKLPRDQALRLIADAMRRGRMTSCLDKLVGELVGEPEPDDGSALEAAWESSRRGE